VTGLVTALVCDTGLRTPSLAMKLLRIIARGVCNRYRSANFGVSRTFRYQTRHNSAIHPSEVGK